MEKIFLIKISSKQREPKYTLCIVLAISPNLIAANAFGLLICMKSRNHIIIVKLDMTINLTRLKFYEWR